MEPVDLEEKFEITFLQSGAARQVGYSIESVPSLETAYTGDLVASGSRRSEVALFDGEKWGALYSIARTPLNNMSIALRMLRFQSSSIFAIL